MSKAQGGREGEEQRRNKKIKETRRRGMGKNAVGGERGKKKDKRREKNLLIMRKLKNKI